MNLFGVKVAGASANRGGAVWANGTTTNKPVINMYFGSGFYGNEASAREGGALALNCADLYIKEANVAFEENRATGSSEGKGGAIYVGENSKLETQINNSNDKVTFRDNTANVDGGAIYNRGVTNLQNSKFHINVATNSGGAIYNISGSLTLNNCSMTNNGANGLDGGAILAYAGNVEINNSLYDSNQSLQSGGAIFGYADSSITITNTELKNNKTTHTSAHGNGGAIGTLGNLTVENCNIHDNYASYGNGGAIYIANSTYENSDYLYNERPRYNNTTLNIYGGIIKNNKAANGAGIYIDKKMSEDHQYSSVIVNINNPNIINNIASENGGAIYLNAKGIDDNHTILNINGGLIEGNKAVSGAGIYISKNILELNDNIYNTQAKVNINNVTIKNNIATGNGGGLCVYNPTTNDNTSIYLNITGSTIKQNSATKGGGLYISINNEELKIQNTTISENVSTEIGGGVYIENATDVNIINTTVVDNNSNLYAAGIYVKNCTLKLSEDIIINNNLSQSNQSNLYLDNTLISFSGNGLGVNSRIGITSVSIPTFDQSVLISNQLTNENYFYSDNSQFVISVEIDNKLYLVLPREIKIIISWTEMSFAYHPGNYNPLTHLVEDTGWKKEAGKGIITIENQGTKNISISFVFSKASNEDLVNLTGKFTDDNNTVISNVVIVPDQIVTINFLPEGAPTQKFTNSTNLGDIKITIRKQEDNN